MKTDRKVDSLSYVLQRRRNSRHITIRVRPDGLVKVSAPYGVSVAAIERVITNNKAKLLSTIDAQRSALHTYREGETFLFAGTTLTLKLVSSEKNAIAVTDTHLLVTYAEAEPQSLVVCTLIKELFRQHVKQRLAYWVPYWANRLSLDVPPYGVRDARSRWGSCSAKGRLSFSLRSQILDDEQFSYLVLHEMAHLVHFNHSAQFHALLGEQMPSYKEIQKSVFALQKESQLCL
ncbi:MAG: M48 family metallopeptidase [Spirochaetales bacterium]|nr:M48 family metallopeptidase [Spirochaetales bacterium]